MKISGFGLGLVLGGIIQLPLAFALDDFPQPYLYMIVGVLLCLFDERVIRFVTRQRGKEK